jgi:hypothetical protein
VLGITDFDELEMDEHEVEVRNSFLIDRDMEYEEKKNPQDDDFEREDELFAEVLEKRESEVNKINPF